MKIPYLPSAEGSFVFHQLSVPLKEFQQHMKQAGVLIDRAFPPTDAWCHISLGTPQEMTFVAKTLHEFCTKGWHNISLKTAVTIMAILLCLGSTYSNFQVWEVTSQC
ncbi:Uncharacterised protein [Serratia quinivorans]|nr:Uncharacterised protein [Serratia quinivorans]